MIQGLAIEFNAEVKSKQDALDATQALLRTATRELAEQRRQIQQGQASCTELDEVQQRIRNLENALRDEESFDWTGRTEVDGTPILPASASVSSNSDTLVSPLHSVAASGSTASTVTSPNLGPGPAFTYRGPASTMAALGGTFDISFNLDADPAIPAVDNPQSLVRLRRMVMWHQRIETLMERRLDRLRGDSAEKELQCRRIVSMCTGVPVDKIEQVSCASWELSGSLTTSRP
jgi:regulatory protein SWI6